MVGCPVAFGACGEAAQHGREHMAQQSSSARGWNLKKKKGLGFQYHLQGHTRSQGSEDLPLGLAP